MTCFCFLTALLPLTKMAVAMSYEICLKSRKPQLATSSCISDSSSVRWPICAAVTCWMTRRSFTTRLGYSSKSPS